MYTNVWNNAAPLGSIQAFTLDEEIRKLRLDIEERMTALVTGFTTGAATDPVVALPELKGNVTGKVLHMHHSIFVAHSATNESRSNLYCAPSTTGTLGFWSPLSIPVGCTLQNVTGTFDRQTLTVSLIVGYTDALTGAVTILATRSDGATAGVFQKDVQVADLAHVIVTGRYYFIEVDLDGFVAGGKFSRFYGAFARYDTPDCRNTQ